MDIYVVSDCWHGDQKVVIGAGADQEAARSVADRLGGDEAKPAGGWSPWRQDPWDVERNVWRRDALNRKGKPHASLQQEIVRVPLAGGGEAPGVRLSPETLRLLERDVAADRNRMRMTAIVNDLALAQVKKVATATDDLDIAHDDVLLRMRELMATWRKSGELERPEIRVGGGPAWEWLKAGLDKVSTYPSDAPMPDARASAMIWGLPIVRDPDVADDEIRVGQVVYKVGHESGLIRPGTVMRYDLSKLPESLRDWYRTAWGPTSPPSRD